MPPRLAGAALVLANGDPPAKSILQKISRKADFLICTDGAYAQALRLGLKPQWVIGDMDSLSPQQRIKKGVRVLYEEDPDCTDLEKAVRFLVKSGCPQAYVAGAIGDRLDHSFAAFQILQKYDRAIRLTLLHRGWSAQTLSGTHSLRARPGTTLSLFPLGQALVSTRGLKYPLRRERLSPGSRGTSNVAVSSRVRIQIHQGRLLLIMPFSQSSPAGQAALGPRSRL